MRCGCRCHVNPGAGCDPAHDKGTSGVVGQPSCSPCAGHRAGVACIICKAKTDGFLCEIHIDRLELAIAEMPALMGALAIAATRQARVFRTAPIRQAETEWADPEAALEARLRSRDGRITLPTTSLPVDLDATRHARAAWTMLAGWARYLATLTGDEPWTLHEGPVHADGWRIFTGRADGPPTITEQCNHPSCRHILECRDRAVDVNTVAAWMVTHIDAIRARPAAGDAYRQLTRLQSRLEHAVDMRPPSDYLGKCDAPDVRVHLTRLAGPPCTPFACDHETCGEVRNAEGVLTPVPGVCGAELYACEHDKQITCDACGTVYDVAARRRDMTSTVDDEWARPHIIARALSQVEYVVKPETLRQWITRDAKLAERLAGRDAPYPLILQRGVDDDGKPLYRVGDVRARIERIRNERETA